MSAYLTIRVAMAMYSVGALTAACVLSAGDEKIILVYLTIWTYIVLTLHLVLAAVLGIIFCSRKRNQENVQIGGVSNPGCVDAKTDNNMNQAEDPKTEDISDGKQTIPWYLQLSWTLGNIVQTFSIVVTVIYFAFIFPTLNNAGSYNDLNLHAVNTAFVIIDFCISARPIQILHFYQPLLYGIAYIVFNVAYWSADTVNNIIYNVLDWNHPVFASIMCVVLAFVIVPLFQLAYFGLYRLKLKCYEKVYGKSF